MFRSGPPRIRQVPNPVTEPVAAPNTPHFAAALGGRYAIERELGSGGMAVVYLAHDVRHDRKVALKVLRPDVAAAVGAERFLAEIKTTAYLQHPHIVPLHDSGEADGVVFYVMPFVEGEGLRDRLKREGQLPVADALRIATQVAAALDYAHRHGVVHRDIKPDNILLHDDSAVVADFGIALAVQSAGTRFTQTGLSVGTPQYMAPEQATGERAVDGRADIYALAAVLYEMLMGEPPFTGPSIQAIVARTLGEEPRSLTAQRRAVPPAVDRAVLRALEKLPADRFSTAGEFSHALNAAADAAVRPQRTEPAASWRIAAFVLAGVSTLLLAAFAWAVAHAGPSALPLVTSRIAPSPDAPSELHDIALSPDGRTLAYVSSAAVDGGRIWLRNMSDARTRVLAGTDGARLPFWAPDGSGIGFFASRELRVVSLASGTVRTLAAAPYPAGGAWSGNGTIVYSPAFRNLWKVPAAGGAPTRAMKPGGGDDSTEGSRDPRFLPDGHRFLYWRSGTDDALVGDLRTGIAHKFADSLTTPTYAAPGYLLYFRPGDAGSLEQPAPLIAQRFDVSRLALVGEPTVLVPRIERPDQVPVVTASLDFLAVREPPPQAGAAPGAHGTIYWLDRKTGRRSDPLKGTGSAWVFRESHDGRRLAVAGPGLSIYDIARDVAVRHPVKIPIGGWPQAWSPDDKFIAVNAGPRIMIVSADASAPERSFDHGGTWIDPMDWSPDGELYFVAEPTATQSHDELWRRNLLTGAEQKLPTGTGDVMSARLSPDWRWIAYESDETGGREIYLIPAQGVATPIRVSKAGGGSPRWRADGKELFWIGADGRIMAAPTSLGAQASVGEAARVADAVVHPEPMGIDPYLDTRFEPSPAGDRFLVQTPLGAGTHELTLIQGWQRLMTTGH